MTPSFISCKLATPTTKGVHMNDPIGESLPYDAEKPEATQIAWYAVVHILIPSHDRAGTPVDSEAAACDYVSETLRNQFLDWGYDRGYNLPSPIEVCKPYVEGTFLD